MGNKVGKVCSACVARDEQAEPPAPPKSPTALSVSIFKASGLKNKNMTGDNIYCLCEMASKDGRPPQMFRTTTKKDLNPEWNEVYDLKWQAETDTYVDGLLFTIYSSGMLADKTEGTVDVKKEAFLTEGGFEGELPIVGCDDGKLGIKIDLVY
mmetsp:Transcript_77790/g.128924  ORF Transcript_77790/g.128924 Transcript_77790/m.128924 type:complete len:153 (-) Transcript_77790:110-568(-)